MGCCLGVSSNANSAGGFGGQVFLDATGPDKLVADGSEDEYHRRGDGHVRDKSFCRIVFMDIVGPNY